MTKIVHISRQLVVCAFSPVLKTRQLKIWTWTWSSRSWAQVFDNHSYLHIVQKLTERWNY